MRGTPLVLAAVWLMSLYRTLTTVARVVTFLASNSKRYRIHCETFAVFMLIRLFETPRSNDVIFALLGRRSVLYNGGTRAILRIWVLRTLCHSRPR